MGLNVSFLKKLGLTLLQVGAQATVFGPLITPFLGSGAQKATQIIQSVTNDLTQIGQVVISIETALHGKEGLDKFKAATALVGPIIMTSQLVSGKKVADPVLLQKGIEEVTQGVVDVLNSLSAESVDKELKLTK